MAYRAEVPGVNAGSMADIAFLLLIFFLVTTSIETDTGLGRLLPRMDSSPPITYNERNILLVLINSNNEIMVNRKLINSSDLKELTIAFLDNGGAERGDVNYCSYCKGARKAEYSENPIKAIVSVKSERETRYGAYIVVQNELIAAYNELRNRESQRLYGLKYTEMEANYMSSLVSLVDKVKLKEKIVVIQKLFPQKISEAEIN